MDYVLFLQIQVDMYMQGPAFALSDSSLERTRRDDWTRFSPHGVTLKVEKQYISEAEIVTTTEASIVRLRVSARILTKSKARLVCSLAWLCISFGQT